ncbi:M1 family metallopeptidase [Massilia sp. erpn]|uniref:M1 family metallopeptidase n=1 Tax=Massilia sp. erpn TaxID=2738142 RepID=UPI002104CFC7|nr:M1 family metallopeptidase [Massilia sp. erpn]UTY55832.1 M1 family metallopeptidase [Massilia sp. erpn]
MQPRPILKSLLATVVVAGLAIQSLLYAQGALVVAVPQPTTDTGIPLAAANAAAVTTPSAPNAWGGPRSGNEATLSDRVVNYQIEATLDPVKHTVTGQQKLTWRNRSDRPVRSVYLHLYLNAFQNANSTFHSEIRRSGRGFRSGVETKDGDWGYIELRSVQQNGAKVDWSFVQPDGGPETDQTVVRLDLPQAVAAGASTTLDIAFFDQLPRVIARTGYFETFHLVAQWFPKIGVLELAGERGATAPRWNAHEFHMESEFYADFGTYDVKLTVPKAFTVGATGQRQGAPVEKDGMLTHHYKQDDVHDFAWTADSRTATPLTGTWTFPGSPEVEIKVLFPPEYASNAAPALKATKDALNFYSKSLGPYPYKTVTVVIPPHNAGEAGGMEYPTFFTADGIPDLQPDTLDAFGLDFVTIHEFGHGYFYGILANNEFEEPMLDEGLNQFWNTRMTRAEQRDIHVAKPWMQRLGLNPVWEFSQAQRLATPLSFPADALGANAMDRLQSIGPVYTRTALAMLDLEKEIGKEALERGFKEYYRLWKFRHPSIADLRETLAEATGQRKAVERVFAQQVYAVSKVDDSIDSLSSEEVLPQPGSHASKGKRVLLSNDAAEKQADEVREKWEKAHPDAKEGSGPFPYHTVVVIKRKGAAVPQTLLVRFADGSSESVKFEGEERWRRFEWTRNSEAVSATLDPEGKHLLDINKLDDSQTLKADRRAQRRWSFDLAALAQTLYTLIATL